MSPPAIGPGFRVVQPGVSVAETLVVACTEVIWGCMTRVQERFTSAFFDAPAS